jgi:hypothetical protein
MKTSLVCACLCLLLITGCKKDNPVGPDGSSTLPTPVSAIIGSAGGTLVTKGFILTVPPAAFAAAETLKVTPQTSDNAFGARALSELFKLEGLPVSFAKSLEVKIECSRTPAAGYSLAIGRQMTSIGSGESMIFYSPRIAVKDSTFLKATLFADSLGTSIRRSLRGDDLISKVKWLLAVDEETSLLSSSGLFKIHYPTYLQTGAQNLAVALENAYKALPPMGFDARAYNWVHWPLEVGVANFHLVPPLPPGMLLVVGVGGQPAPRPAIGFQEDLLLAGDLPTLQRAAGQAFCDLFFTINDKFFWEKPNGSMMQVERNRLWPYYAVGAWAGEIVMPPGTVGDAPLNFRLLQMCPLDGLTIGSDERPWTHGLGLSPLIKYMAETYTPSSVVKLYYKIPDVKFAIDALVATLMPVAEREWWPDFLKQYIAGKIYDVTSDDLLKDLGSRVFTIQGAKDTLKKFSDTYADLSARLYRVNLRYAGIDTSALIRFSAGPASLGSQYVGVMLFGLKDKKLTYWQYANTVTVKQIKDLTASGYDIVAAVINCLNASPYDGSRTIDLTVTVEPGAGKPMTASFRVKLRGTETSGPTPFTGPGSMSYSSGFRKGTMAGGIFTAVWSETSPDFPSGTLTVNGELTIQLDGTAPPARVIRFSAKETILHSAYSREVWEAASSASCDVPAYWEYNRWVHRASGTTVRNMVTTAVNRYDSFGDGYWRTFSNPSSDAADLVEIVIE